MTTRAKKEPTTAPRMPASSGSRESPAVKKVVLKRFSIRPSSSRWSTHASWSSSTRRSSSGRSRSMCPFMSMSMSSSAGTHTSTVVPTRAGFASTISRTWYAAPVLIMPFSLRRSRRFFTSGKRLRSDCFTAPW